MSSHAWRSLNAYNYVCMCDHNVSMEGKEAVGTKCTVKMFNIAPEAQLLSSQTGYPSDQDTAGPPMMRPSQHCSFSLGLPGYWLKANLTSWKLSVTRRDLIIHSQPAFSLCRCTHSIFTFAEHMVIPPLLTLNTWNIACWHLNVYMLCARYGWSDSGRQSVAETSCLSEWPHSIDW